MKSLISALKANPVIVASVLAALASVAGLVYAYSMRSAQLELLKERVQTIAKVDKLLTREVTLPPKTSGERPSVVRTWINRDVIDKVTRMFAQFRTQGEAVLRFAVERNRQGHALISDSLFHEQGEQNYERFTVKSVYRQKLTDMLGSGPAEGSLPRIDAGPTPSEKEIDDALNATTRRFLRDLFPPKSNTDKLNAGERSRLRDAQAKRVTELLEKRAKSIHLYAQGNPQQPGFPLEVPKWSRETTDAEKKYPPTMSELWDGQMDLWIIQDLLQVIALTNQAQEPSANVLNEPVKRLISIQVAPNAAAPGAGGGGAPRTAAFRLKPNYALSPSGRYSNPLYDVRQAELKMVVDFQRLPEFFNRLAQVNFMTVLTMQIKDVDEFEEMKKGYVYGAGDCVEVTMLIETVWLRAWTAGNAANPGPMPKEVRTDLGLGF